MGFLLTKEDVYTFCWYQWEALFWSQDNTARRQSYQ